MIELHYLILDYLMSKKHYFLVCNLFICLFCSLSLSLQLDLSLSFSCSFSVELSLSLSLTLSHTHTHINYTLYIPFCRRFWLTMEWCGWGRSQTQAPPTTMTSRPMTVTVRKTRGRGRSGGQVCHSVFQSSEKTNYECCRMTYEMEKCCF